MSDIESLKKNGYVLIRGAVDQGLCEKALERVDKMKRRNRDLIQKNVDDYGHLYRVVNLHLALTELMDLFSLNARGLSVCDEFFGRSTALYTSLYFERGSEQPLHRDTPYFTTKPAGSYLGVWLALDDVDDENGPLRVVPGSHELPPIDIGCLRRDVFGDGPIPSGSMEGWERYQSEVQKQCDDRALTAVNVHVKRGDVVIWHPEMFHGGAPHFSKQRSRRSLVMHVTPEGVPVYHMDVFYEPEKKVGTKVRWKYTKHGGRLIAKFDQVDFGHEFTVKPKKLC